MTGLVIGIDVGGTFTPDIAAQLAIPRVLSPALASALSAFGAATAPVRSERSRNIKRLLDAPGRRYGIPLHSSGIGHLFGMHRAPERALENALRRLGYVS